MAKRNANPIVFIVGGPNGAGKSTAAATVFGEEARAAEFLNADTIARGLSAFQPERAAFAAGRVMLSRIKELFAENATFAFESTLASRTFAPMLAEQRGRGYRVNLLYVWVSSPEISLKRVASRVAGGGHNIPEEDVRRRFGRSTANFMTLYRPIADRWMVLNNSGSDAKMVAEGGSGLTERVADRKTWNRMLEISNAQGQSQS
jgi:predicted ABC-type ATPase